MTEPVLQPRGVRGVASKLHDYHLQRLAIVYVTNGVSLLKLYSSISILQTKFSD
jgi:hypothetical protein